YRLFKAQHKLRYVCFDFEHNYNQTSREAVYTWFNRWLLNSKASAPVKELPYQKEPDHDLRVWPDGQLPGDALNESQLIDSLIKLHKPQCQTLRPTEKKSLSNFKRAMWPLWRHPLQVKFPTQQSLMVETGKTTVVEGLTATRFAFGRTGKGDRIPAIL